METRQGFAKVNGARLYYEVAGEGRPLVLLHGFSLDTRMWDDQFEPLARQFQVIRYDLRGFGRSSLSTGEYIHADDLRALLDSLGIVRGAICGFSMGGGIAIDFALMYPQYVSGLIAVDSTLGGFRGTANWNVGAREYGVEVGRKNWLAHPIFQQAMQRPALAARLSEMINAYSGWHWLNHDPGRGAVPPAAERLNEIAAPTLIIVGERDLPDFHAIAERLHTMIMIPGSRREVIPGAGHMVSMEAPAAVNTGLTNFVTGLEFQR